MESLASVPELELHLGRTFAGDEPEAAEQALKLATAVIQAHTGQHFFPATTAQTFHHPANFTVFGGVLVLRQRPVVAVTSIVVDGTVFPDFTFDPASGVVHVDRAPEDIHTLAWTRQVVVTYDHGYTAIPGQLKAVCLDLARQEFDNPSGYSSITIGDFSASYGRSAGGSVPTGLMLTDRHERLLAGLR